MNAQHSFTTFFKDAEKQKEFLKEFLSSSNSEQVLTIWDAGCGAGHSTYSLAILIAEYIGIERFNHEISIIATDIDEIRTFGRAVKSAVFYRNELMLMSTELINKYFISDAEGEIFKVIPAIREKVIFLRHDLLSLQPPVASVDAIICLNVLHHFSSQEQIRVLDMFKRIVPDNLILI